MTHVLRTGAYTLTKLLLKLCSAITKFSPILITLSGNDPALIAALSGATTACEGLRLAVQPYLNADY